MKCIHCGSELMPGSKFCINCGAPTTEPEVPAAVPEVSNGSQQDPMGNWPAPDFSSAAETASSDSNTAETPQASQQPVPPYGDTGSQDIYSYGTDVSSQDASVQGAPTQEILSQEPYTSEASYTDSPVEQGVPVYPQDVSEAVSDPYSQDQAKEIPPVNFQDYTGNVPSAYPQNSNDNVPPMNSQSYTENVPPVYPQNNNGGVPPVYPQNYTGNVPPAYPQNNNGGTPPVYPNQSYYPQPGFPQVPAPQKKSNKLIIGIVLGIAALIIALIVVLLVILFNNQNKQPAPASSGTASSSVSSDISSGSSIVSGETKSLTIGNASFQVPVDWDAEINDDGTILLYPSDEETIVIYCFADEAQYFGDNDYLEEYAKGYDEYQYIGLAETAMGGVLGKLHTYYAYVSDIDYKISSFYYTIGDDLMSVDYFCPLLSSSDGIQPLEDVMATMQITESANTGSSSSSATASSDGGSVSAQDAYGEGMYKVGADLPAGEYVLLPASEFSAYYEVNTSSGESGDIIDNDNFDGRRYLTVADGQYLTIQRCMMVPLDKAPAVDISSGIVPEGMYRVGVDIPAGEYKLHNTSEYEGYYEVRSSSIAEEGFDSILTNDNFSGDVYVTVEDGQYLVVNRAELHLPQ